MDAPRQGDLLWCKRRRGCLEWESSLSPEAPEIGPRSGRRHGIKGETSWLYSLLGMGARWGFDEIAPSSQRDGESWQS